MTESRRCFRIVAALAILFLAPRTGGAGSFKDPSVEEEAIVEDPAKGLEGAVYLERHFVSTGRALETYVRAKILSKAGYDLATVDGLDAGAYDIEGRTVSPAGKVTPLPPSDVHEMTTVKAGGVSVRRKGFTLPAIEPGCFVEYRYRESGELGSGGAKHVELPFQARWPILLQTVRTPRVFRFGSSARVQNGVELSFETDGNEYVYIARNMRPLRPEPYGLPKWERPAGLVFAYTFPDVRVKTAEEFWPLMTKKGFVPFLNDGLIRAGRVEDPLRKIPGKRSEDPIARAKVIYDFVRTSVRNREALPFPEKPPAKGWDRNDDAGDALSSGSGTPFDLAVLYESMLRADGFEFRHVFVPDREERFFHREIPSFYQVLGGHVVEVRGGGLAQPVLVTFEHPTLPFGLLPWNFTGGTGWAVDPTEIVGETLELPVPEASHSTRKRSFALEISGDSVSVTKRTELVGLRAFPVRAEIFREGRSAWEKEVRDDLRNDDPPAEAGSIAVENESDPDQPLRITTSMTVSRLVESLPGGRLVLSPLRLIGFENKFTSSRRSEPIDFPHPWEDEDELRIRLPEGYAASELPKLVELRTPVGFYRVAAEKKDEDTILIRRKFRVELSRSGPEGYPQFRKLFEAAAREDAGYSIVVTERKP